MAYLTPPRHFIQRPQPAAPTHRAQHFVSPTHPSWPASPPMWNEYMIEDFEVTQLVSLDSDLVTDSHTLANRNIPPRACATVEDHYYEIRGVPPSREFVVPSGDVSWERRTKTSTSRSTRNITGTSAPNSSGGGHSLTYYGRHRDRVLRPVISEVEDGSEDDEASEPASTVSRDSPSAMEVYGVSSHHQGRRSRPLIARRVQATAAPSGLSRRPLKGLKKMFHKMFGKFRRKKPTGYPPPTPAYPPSVSTPAATTSTFTMSPTPWNAYYGVQYYDEFNTGVSVLEMTQAIQIHMPPRHPLTLGTEQARTRVQRARDNELERNMRSANGVRRIHEWRDGMESSWVRR